MPAIITTSGNDIWFVRADAPYKVNSAEDLPKAKGILFGSSTGATGWMFVAAKELLNLPTEKVVIAYGGSADSARAFLAGEVNMGSVSIVTYMDIIAPHAAKGEAIPLLQAGMLDDKGNLVRDPDAPPVPTLKELYEKLNGKPPSGVAWEAYRALRAAAHTYWQTLFVPPGTPDAIVRAYWDASEKMLKDAEFRKIATVVVGAGSKFKAGEALDKEFKLNFGMDPKVVDWLRVTLREYGVVMD